MATEFVHLHVHTDYSLLDSTCKISGLVNLAKEYNMPSMAITDHGVMGGVIDFYNVCSRKGIKPIVGCEMHVSPTHHKDRDYNVSNIKGYHLVLLAKDFEGYQNLCKLNSIAHLEGCYYKPRVDKELLGQYSKGLIALSACLHGELAVKILGGKTKEANKALADYIDIFGRENFYLELMDHGMKEEKIVNKALISMSKEFDASVVATNDVHYLKREHSKTHEILVCIQNNLSGKKRFKSDNDEFYFKSGDEMLEVFKEIPEAIKNTLIVADKCNLKIPLNPEVNHHPIYEIKSGKSQKDELREICLANIEDRYGFKYEKFDSLTVDQKLIIERIDYELSIIDKLNHSNYFLIVWDIFMYARESRIPMGTGRGSAPGSIVAYLAHITDVDPIKYNLIFERFINPERNISSPGIYIDCCKKRRFEIIEYLRTKYSKENSALASTDRFYSKDNYLCDKIIKAKSPFKDVGRVLGHSIKEINLITKLIPEYPCSLTWEREWSKKLNSYLERNLWADEIYKNCEILEGLRVSRITLPAAFIVGNKELANLLPLYIDEVGDIATQYNETDSEYLGLLNLEFIGITVLTLIQETIDEIKKNRGIDLDISKIPLDDKKTYVLMNEGDTKGLFQLESSGMRKLCRKFGINNIADISVLLAVYRPGPMQYIDDFINRKWGKVTIKYDHPKMKEVLKETYGVIIYQEQIIELINVLAGLTYAEADIMRRAFGRKKVDELEIQKRKFTEGCAKYSSIPESLANTIWEKIEMFAGYAFQKAHSTAYALLAYRTAYLKANFPEEYKCALKNCKTTYKDLYHGAIIL